jgi:hypothetical protein
MLYVKTDDNIQLTSYCKNCTYSIVEDHANLITALTDSGPLLGDGSRDMRPFMDASVKHDVTLPRVNNIACKNPSCTKNPDDQNQVIYIKHSPENMKFTYFCCHCDYIF